VHEPLQLRDVLALLSDRLADVPFLDNEDQLVAGVHAIDDGRPGQVLEKRDVLDRLLVKDNLGHGAQALRMFDSPGLRTATADTGSGFGTADGYGSPAGGWLMRFSAPVPRVTGCPTMTFSATPSR